MLQVETPSGPARFHVRGSGPGRVVLGHGAGGGVDAPDLRAVEAAALALGLQVVLVEQPWRVAGRRVAEAPPRLDAAWLAVLAALPPLPGPLVVGGRSAGARVACRTAGAVGAAGVLALAFPLVPPGRDVSREDELHRPEVPVLVVQGARDAFGVPAAAPGREVVVVPGADHGFAVRRRDGTPAEVAAAVTAAAREWLARLAPGGQALT